MGGEIEVNSKWAWIPHAAGNRLRAVYSIYSFDLFRFIHSLSDCLIHSLHDSLIEKYTSVQFWETMSSGLMVISSVACLSFPPVQLWS